MIILGFDPGGTSGVGLLRCDADGLVIETQEVASVSSATDWVRTTSGAEVPAIIGIDAFLHWGLGRSGKRFVDESILKTCYPNCRQSVLSQNSTYGAMAIQGMALAIEMRRIWPEICLNEVHPKVLYFAVTSTSYPREATDENQAIRKNFFEHRGFKWRGNYQSEHEFDAAICCFASYQGIRGFWTKDLMADVATDEYGAFLLPAGPAKYYWPDLSSVVTPLAERSAERTE